MTSGSDTMLNYHLSQKLKLIGKGKFNINQYFNILVLFPVWDKGVTGEGELCFVYFMQWGDSM
jgi:hypothetical protein